jgi:electron transfer flavoprotein alpha subunit
VLVWSERDQLAHELLTFAGAHRSLLGPTYAAVFGEQAAARAEAYRSWEAVCNYVNESVEPTDEALAHALAGLAEHLQVKLVLLGATRRGRATAPRMAQMLGAGCVSEAVELAVEDGQLITSRFTLGGNTLSRERILTARKVIAAVPGAVALGPEDTPGGVAEAGAGTPRTAASNHAGPRRAAAAPFQPPVARRSSGGSRPPAGTNLAGSERLVCIERGLERAEPAADPTGRGAGSRAGLHAASTEYGWLPEGRARHLWAAPQPRLMLSLGCPASAAHGGDHGFEADRGGEHRPRPHLQTADYGIVGDLYQVAPRLRVGAVKADRRAVSPVLVDSCWARCPPLLQSPGAPSGLVLPGGIGPPRLAPPDLEYPEAVRRE